MPPRWSTFVQPEGKPYFCHDGLIQTVTESWIYTPEIASEAEKWIEYITFKVKEKKNGLTNLEIYIRIDDILDCLYYVVDKQEQTIFWVDDYSTEDLGLPPVVSPSHLSKLNLRVCVFRLIYIQEPRSKRNSGSILIVSLLILADCLRKLSSNC